MPREGVAIESRSAHFFPYFGSNAWLSNKGVSSLAIFLQSRYPRLFLFPMYIVDR
jgi:hypothetical protein